MEGSGEIKGLVVIVEDTELGLQLLSMQGDGVDGLELVRPHLEGVVAL